MSPRVRESERSRPTWSCDIERTSMPPTLRRSSSPTPFGPGLKVEGSPRSSCCIVSSNKTKEFGIWPRGAVNTLQICRGDPGQILRPNARHLQIYPAIRSRYWRWCCCCAKAPGSLRTSNESERFVDGTAVVYRRAVTIIAQKLADLDWLGWTGLAPLPVLPTFMHRAGRPIVGYFPTT